MTHRRRKRLAANQQGRNSPAVLAGSAFGDKTGIGKPPAFGKETPVQIVVPRMD